MAVLGAPTRLPSLVKQLVAWSAAVAVVGLGMYGAYRYVDNFWLYRGYAPPKDAAYVHSYGYQQTIQVRSAAIGGRSQAVTVYLPAGYTSDPTRRWPVMYLLHGSPGFPLAFLDAARMGALDDELVAKHRIGGMILVIPTGSTDPFQGKQWANGVTPANGWETFLARDVVHAIDSRYRTIAHPGSRTLAGLSEGGYGALNVGLHHPREFGVIESWSGYENAERVTSIFGTNPQRLAYNSPSAYLPHVAHLMRRHHFVWVYSGRQDGLHRENVMFARELTRYHIPHLFQTFPGGHNWRLWRVHARQAMLIAAHWMHDDR